MSAGSWSRLIRVVGGCALALILLYLVPVNALLWTKFFANTASEGEGRSFNLNHGFAWSLWPGHIHLRDLSLIGTDRNVVWRVKLDRVEFRARLSRLLKRQFSVASLNGRGTRVEVDQHSPETRDQVRAFLNQVEAESRADLEHEADTGPWRVSIANVELDDVRLVRIDEVAYRGTGSIRGSFELHPGRFLELQGGQWEIADGSLSAGDVPILHGMRGLSRVRIHPTALEKAPGSEIYRTMDIEQSLRARVLGAQGFAALLRSYRPLVLGRADGDLESELRIERGRLLPGSRIAADFRKIDLALAGASLAGTGRLRWTVAPGPDPTGRLDLKLNRVVWRETRAGKPGRLLAESRDLSIRGRTRELSLVSPFGDLVLTLALRDARMGSLQAVLRHLLGHEAKSYPVVASSSGRFGLTGRLVPARKSFRGALDLRSDAFTVSYDEGVTRLRAQLSSRVEMISRNYESGRFRLHKGDFNFRNLRVLREGEDDYVTQDWSMNVALADTELATEPEVGLDGTFRVRMSDIKAPLRFALPESSWVPIATFFYPMNAFDLRGQVRADKTGFTLSRLAADSSTGKMFGHARVREGEMSANLLLELNPLNVCLDKRERKDLDVDVGASAEDCLRPEPILRRLGE